MADQQDQAYRPLRGVRVLSFEIAFSLPAGTRVLAELGAEVVRVAGPDRASGQYIGVVDGVFFSKPCVGLNLRNEDGLAVARRMIAQADVVAYNFTPNVMERFGLNPDALLALKPSLVVLQLSGYGVPGPWRDFPAFGPSTEAAGGLNALCGLESDPPIRAGSGVFSDQLGGRYAALALMGAIERAQRTGRGAILDLSMSEAITTLIGPELVGYGETGVSAPRIGNRHPTFAPQGVYPCAGVDEWVAISITSASAWAALVSLAGDPSLGRVELDSAAGRRVEHDAIDASIARWTSCRSKDEVAAELQAAGVAAGPVRKPQDGYFDEHLRSRGAFQLVEHDRTQLGYEAHPHLLNPWLFSGQARTTLTDYRPTGADNVDVLSRWLGIDELEVQGLQSGGALLLTRNVEMVKRDAPEGTPIDDKAGERLGLPVAQEATP